MSLHDFLIWLASSSGAGVGASFILARIAWYVALPAEKKQWWFFGVCSVLSIGSYSVITYVPPEILSQIAPFFALLASAFAATFIGQAFNRLDTAVNKTVGRL